jgi:transaldolase
MTNQLSSLREMTTVVADTGDIEAIRKYQPVDATTNPSLLLKAAEMPQYAHLIDEAVAYAKSLGGDINTQVDNASDKLAVSIGSQIQRIIPGKISTEVDARLSFDTQATIEKANKLINLYADAGVEKSRILIKVASTWEGIKAAEQLEQAGITCNLTLLFSFAQAQACAEAGVFLISPFVGRILDWYKKSTGKEGYAATDDPGVQSVTRIYDYYKQHGYNTVVMGASFRNTDEIIELAGCDRLTISPQLLEQLANTSGILERKLTAADKQLVKPAPLTEEQFRWAHNQDAMATEKLAEGIRNFATDQEKLEVMLRNRLS